MKEERSVLQNTVFPKLENACEENGARFQAVDLRWGVNEESQLNQKTLDICLHEIARCQRISPKPNFLLLLGDKYGWQPLPPRIPESEMRDIHDVLTTDQRKMLDKWYCLDTNAAPPEGVLQPRGTDYRDYAAWGRIEVELQSVLRAAVNQLPFTTEQRHKYFTSATHQEILSGALTPGDALARPEDHVLAMIRETVGLPIDHSAAGFIDLINDRSDLYSKDQLTRLKMQLRQKLRDHCVSYHATWKDGRTVMNDPSGFARTVYEFLHSIVTEQLRETSSPDELAHETQLHADFKTRLTEHFCGREEVLGTLHTYLHHGAQGKTLALIGDSGSGKSSVMARAIQEGEEHSPDAITVYRFIGTTSRSSSTISLLRSVCGQVAGAFGTTLDALAGEGKENVRYDVTGLTELLRKCLALSTPETPVLLFLDALDQLADSDRAQSLSWLPETLPENCRLVVSSLSEFESRLSTCHCLMLPVLPTADAEQLLDRWLNSIHRTLTGAQRAEVLRRFQPSGLPIYLTLSFEHVKTWHSYTRDYDLKSSVPGIINDFVDLLEHEHSHELVKTVICYILCGRYQGLAESELLELLAFDQDYWSVFLNRSHAEHRPELVDQKQQLGGRMKIPIVIWSRLFLALEPFLTERDADGVPIIAFFHRQFNDVLSERYGLMVSLPGASE